MANRSAGFHGEFFSRIVFLSPAFKSLTLSSLFYPSSLVFFSPFFFYLGGAGVKGRGRGKTFDSAKLSWRNPFTDLCILAHKGKWVRNFPPDWGATKHTSTFTGSQGTGYSLPAEHREPFGFAYLMVKVEYYTRCEVSRPTCLGKRLTSQGELICWYFFLYQCFPTNEDHLLLLLITLNLFSNIRKLWCVLLCRPILCQVIWGVSFFFPPVFSL